MNLTLTHAQAREITIRYLREQHSNLMELFDDVYPYKSGPEVAAEIIASADKLLKVIEYLGSMASDRDVFDKALRAQEETNCE